MSTQPITSTTIGWWETCAAIREHTGDPYTVDTDDTRLQKWTCCDTAETLGELYWCEGCSARGLTPPGATLPDRWVEDHHRGHLCPDCQGRRP